MQRTQSTADTATTEAESEPMQVDGSAAEVDAGPSGYSSYEETDLEDEESAQGAWLAAQQLLDAAARDAVLVQRWGGGGAETQSEALPAGGQQQERAQQEQQPPAAAAEASAAAAATAALPPGPGHSREWKAVRRSVEWRARWLEHRLSELQHQQQRYEAQLLAEDEAQARQQACASPPAAAAAAQQTQEKAQQRAQPAAQAAQQQQQLQQQAAAQAQQQQQQERAAMPPPPPRAWVRRPRRKLDDCQLPDLLQHPFVAVHSTLGARHAAAEAAGGGEGAAAAAAAAAVAAGPAAMDCDDFPAEVHAALELLDAKLSSLRRQLVALQKPATQAALQRVPAVRVPGYRGGGGGVRNRGGFTPRSAGATPRGTPRGSSGLFRDNSLSKRRRVQVRADRASWQGGCPQACMPCKQVCPRACATGTLIIWSFECSYRPLLPALPRLPAPGVRHGGAHHAAGGPQVCGESAGAWAAAGAWPPPPPPLPLLPPRAWCSCAGQLQQESVVGLAADCAALLRCTTVPLHPAHRQLTATPAAPPPLLQVKTIDTPRVRTLPQTEVKKRQAAIEAFAAQRKQGEWVGRVPHTCGL